MASLEDMPALKALFATLMAQKDAIEAVVAPLRDEYDALQEQMTPMLDRQRKLGTEIQTIIAERGLGAIQNQLSAIARASGGRSISQSMDSPQGEQTVIPNVDLVSIAPEYREAPQEP